MTKLTGVLSNKDLEKLRLRNELRVSAAIDRLGSRYLCHPVNRVARKPPEQVVSDNYASRVIDFSFLTEVSVTDEVRS